MEANKKIGLAVMIFFGVSAGRVFAETMEIGVASRCVMDSQYLAGASEKGFEFDGDSKKGTLNFSDLAAEAPGITFQNSPYRRGSLMNLGLPLSPMPGVVGTARLSEDDGDSAIWEVQCSRSDSAILSGMQWASKSKFEGLLIYGRQNQAGWPLLQAGSTQGWVFLPDDGKFGLPGTQAGREIDGALIIGEAKDKKLRFPSSNVEINCKRVKIKFKPKTQRIWTCTESGCTAGPASGKAGDPEFADFSRAEYIFWKERGGVLAELSRSKSALSTKWSWQWYAPN